ncbi:MAG: alpha/beta hydrolase [Pseudomonadota bacterium]
MPLLSGIDYDEGGAGEAVICLHGIGGDASSFAPQIGALPMRVLSWSMPGYRRSMPGKLSFAALSETLARFMDALGLDQAHIMGQSIGGMVAMEFAARAPERAKSLALIGTTPSFGGRDESFKEEFLKARLAPLAAGMTMAEMAKGAARAVTGPDASAEVIAAVVGPMAAVPPATWCAILECLVTFNRRDDLAVMAMPACLIAGTHDQNAPARTMQKMAEKMPAAEYHLIAGAGHMINQEKPAEVNAILTDFYGRLT